MVDKKITDFSAVTSVADADLLYVVDVSDTTDSAAGTSKKVTVGNVRESTALYYGITAAETAAAVTPTAYQYEPGNVFRYGAVGDGVTDDTASILSAFTVAHSNTEGVVHFPHGEYIISSTTTPGTSAAWDALTVTGDNARITVKDGATAFSYALYVNSTTNMELSISGLEIDCNDLCANGIFIDVRDANPSTLSASGLCRIDARVFDVKKASTVTAAASGITVIGAFADIHVTGEVNSVTRANHASLGNECQGIAITDLVGVARVSARVTSVSSPSASDVDADGISIFGRGTGTGIKTGKAAVDGCEVSECRGRHMKVQVSDAVVTRSTFKQTELAMITQSSSIDLQFGNGTIHDNSFYYRENTGGTSPLGSSHTVIEAQQDLTDTEMICNIHDNSVFTEVILPNFISYSNGASANFSMLQVHHNQVRGIEDLTADGATIDRAFIEIADEGWVTNDGLAIKCNDNTFAGDATSKMIGYTGHNGTDDLDDKFYIECVNNENRGNASCKVFDSLSGSDITQIEGLKFWGNVKCQCFFSNLNTDLNELPEGTDFSFDLATATIANGPGNLPSSGSARIVTGSNATSTWYPATIALEDASQSWSRVSATWRSDNHGASEVVTTTNVITADEAGTTFYLDAAGGFTSTLPAPAIGLKYKFIVSTAPTTAYIITTNGGANILQGTYIDIVGEMVSIASQDTLNFVANTALVGDYLEVESDGTSWFCNARSGANGGITVAVT
jgi:hypothetical protein